MRLINLATLVLWLSCATCSTDPLQRRIQALIDEVADKTGFAIGVGLVDASGRDFGIGAGPRTPKGLPQRAAPGSLDGNDTYVLGSGTKPYTSVCVLRLALGSVHPAKERVFTYERKAADSLAAAKRVQHEQDDRRFCELG